jgi:nucleoid-associated protein YgaU
VFGSIDYQDLGPDSGKISLSGTGDPGQRITLFYDEIPLGPVTIGSDGTWNFEVERKLASGEHVFRADALDATSGAVVGRASIGVVRMEKAPPKEEQVAASETPKPAAPTTGSETKPAGTEAPAPKTAQTAPPEPAKRVAPIRGRQAQGRRHRPRVYTVRRGDTLWEIAESYYGGGWHYRAIARDNRRKIHNPNLIYPRQKLHIPAR